MALTGCISIDLTDGPPDEDGDGVPDVDDEFPDNEKESNDADDDGTGDNEDPDDDNDGVFDTNDSFPFDANETGDNDLDGIGDNADPDDDNDGFPDDEDHDPFHDLALSFTFDWVNLSVRLNSRSWGWFYFDLYENGVRLKRFDNGGSLFRIYWEEENELGITFEMNVPDNVTKSTFQIAAYYARFFSATLLDINADNSTYVANITYDLSTGSIITNWNDNSTDDHTNETVDEDNGDTGGGGGEGGGTQDNGDENATRENDD